MSENESVIPWIEVDVKTLPSRGLPYPEGSKLKYRTYSFGEVKMASISSPEIVELVESTMKGIETQVLQKEKLTFLDVLYIGILRKISTVRDGQYEVPYICNACEAQGKAVFSARSLEFNSLSEDIKVLPLVGQISGMSLEFMPLTVKDFLTLQKGRWQKVIVGGEPDRVSLHAMMVQNLDFEAAYKFLYGLTAQDDIDVVEEIDKMLLHDIKPISAACKNEIKGVICNHENKILLQGREQLIRPFRDGESSVRSRISAGVPRDN